MQHHKTLPGWDDYLPAGHVQRPAEAPQPQPHPAVEPSSLEAALLQGAQQGAGGGGQLCLGQPDQAPPWLQLQQGLMTDVFLVLGSQPVVGAPCSNSPAPMSCTSLSMSSLHTVMGSVTNSTVE